MSGEFSRWLRGLDTGELAALLRLRHDVLREPVPRSLDDLGRRLTASPSCWAAMHDVSAAAVLLSQVLQALGGDVRRDVLLGHVEVGDPVRDAGVELALAELTSRGLVIEHGGSLCLAGGMRSLWSDPLGLGTPLLGCLIELPDYWLTRICRSLGLRSQRRDASIRAVVAHLTPVRIRTLVEDAPPASGRLIRDIVASGFAEHEASFAERDGIWEEDSPYMWLIVHGLLFPTEPLTFRVPLEVTEALRGNRWTVRLPVEPPELVTSQADPAAVERESASASSSAVAVVTELLELVGREPVTAVKSGGIGIRELRRLAKQLHRDEVDVAIAAQTAWMAGLLTPQQEQVLVTSGYDVWRDAEPAMRLATVLRAWWQFPSAVTGGVDDRGKPVPALLRVEAPALVALRQGLLATLAEIEPGRGAVSRETVWHRMLWRHPLAYVADDPAQGLAHAWNEAERLGLVAHGRATRLGAALVADESETLLEVARELLPPAVGVAVLQADLTAVVPGSPSAVVATLLDECAEREGRGTATIWRFSPASVRGYLDAGGSAEDLVTRLGEISRGDLPQPLRYLISDVARRHGHLAVTSLACAVVADDAALLSEVAHHRSLRALMPRLLAPTVMASAKPLGETMRLLRTAGYSPVHHDRSGNLVVERRAAHRAGERPPADSKPAAPEEIPAAAAETMSALESLIRKANEATSPTRQLRIRPPTVTVDPDELASVLVKARPDQRTGPASVTPLRPRSGIPRQDVSLSEVLVADLAPALAPEEVTVLAEAIDTGDPVEIAYRDRHGSVTRSVISGCQLSPPVLEAWDHLRDRNRAFTLANVESVLAWPPE